MSSSAVRDKIYLPMVGLQLIGMLVPLYPLALWQPASSPLHGLVSLRKWWATRTGDPFFAGSAAHEPWFEALLYVEAMVQLPMAVVLVCGLGGSSPGGRGHVELAGLVFGCVTAVGSLACCFDLWRGGVERVGEDLWGRLFWGTYLPFVVVPALMAIDMYVRLLRRVRTPAK